MFRNKEIIPYMMYGEYGHQKSFQQLTLLYDCGCRIIEVGVAYSDPTADGPVIQAAAKRARENGITLSDCIKFINEAKEIYPDVHFILMTYLNPVLQYGIKRLSKICAISGLIIPDLPLEEFDLLAATQQEDVAHIALIPINTPRNRVKEILAKTQGFIYIVAVKGLTGNKEADLTDIEDTRNYIAEFTKRPIVAGFGIREKSQVTKILKICDGAVIGSQLIRYFESDNKEAIKKLLSK